MYNYGQRDVAPRPALNIPRGGFGLTVTISAQDLFVIRVIQQAGTSKVYPLQKEAGGYLEVVPPRAGKPGGLAGLWLTNDFVEPQQGNAGLPLATAGTFISPAISSHLVGTVPYIFHTHPTPVLGPNGYAISPIHIGDILVFYYDNKAKLAEQGTIVFAMEGAYVVTRKDPTVAIAAQLQTDRFHLQREETRIWEYTLDTLINRGRADPRATWDKIPNNADFVMGYIAQRIPTVMIPLLNRLYNPYNIEFSFTPVEYNAAAKTWMYGAMTLVV